MIPLSSPTQSTSARWKSRALRFVGIAAGEGGEASSVGYGWDAIYGRPSVKKRRWTIEMLYRTPTRTKHFHNISIIFPRSGLYIVLVYQV